MIELILGIAMAVLFSCSHVWLYRRGLKDGLALKDNKPIEPIKSPAEVIHERIEAKEVNEAEKAQAQFITNLFGYDGSKQGEVIR